MNDPRTDRSADTAILRGVAGSDLSTLPKGRGRWRLSGFWRYVVRRALLVPVQLVFVLLILYLAINVPATITVGPPEGFLGYVQGFYQVVINDFTGNWGTTNLQLAGYVTYQVPWTQVYAYYIPPSIQIAVFALPIAAALAYPLSLLAGWSRRPGLDTPARFLTLTGALLPVFVVATLVMNAVFFSYLAYFGDIPSQGLIPSVGWFILNGGYPSWFLYDFVTRPTGFPLVDALLHQSWTIATISLTKTLLQAAVVAVAYVAIFFRHARSVVRSVSEEAYIVGARARGISERTLLWRHAARRVTPSFLLIFALTIPEYLGVQFAVEAAFVDQSGFGFLTFTSLTQGNLAPLDALVFLLAILVLVWAFAVDLLAIRLDPRGVTSR
ncbi:MAG: ABC transporter permease [Thermoplasmata archaeon]|jgi:peptide/nickel transport system permease protein